MAAYVSLGRKPSYAAEDDDDDEQIVFTDDETSVECFSIDGFGLSVLGSEDDEEYFEYRFPIKEPKCDSDRACWRKRRLYFRTVFAVLLAIVAISFGALVPSLWKTKYLKTESRLKGANQSKPTRTVACSNGHNLKIASWLGQNKTDSASICDPTVSGMQLFHQIGDPGNAETLLSYPYLLHLFLFPHSYILRIKQQI